VSASSTMTTGTGQFQAALNGVRMTTTSTMT
jgi:hypothetical protein